MEDIDIYGKHIYDIPSLNTIKTLEKLQNYILKKLQYNIDNNQPYISYQIREVRALERTINLLKWIQNNISNDTVKETITKYKQENAINTEEALEWEDQLDREKNTIISNIPDEYFNKKHKLKLTLFENNGVKYISLESKRRKVNGIAWKNNGKIKMTLNKMEKIFKKIKNIESCKNENNG
jgi:hypothetical protein